jgi:hypothetical protein
LGGGKDKNCKTTPEEEIDRQRDVNYLMDDGSFEEIGRW